MILWGLIRHISSLLPFHTDAGFLDSYVESTVGWMELPMPFRARYSPQIKYNGLIQCHREETNFKLCHSSSYFLQMQHVYILSLLIEIYINALMIKVVPNTLSSADVSSFLLILRTTHIFLIDYSPEVSLSMLQGSIAILHSLLDEFSLTCHIILCVP